MNQTVEARLEELLPLLRPKTPEVHAGAALLEVADAALLLELVSNPAVRATLLGRLAPNVALIDPGRAQELVEILSKRGHTPKVVES